MSEARPDLCYVDDRIPGIGRKRRGRAWHYFDAKGKRIADRAEIDRLNAIGMPPAYERVWFCPDPNGHIQAIGYDSKGRRQYRYHPEFRARRDSRKYDKLAAFGRALAALRKQVNADIAGKATGCDAVVAAVVRLIDTTHMRIGNEEYARENKSFGATTLRNRHVSVTGAKVRIAYTGKHGIKRVVTVTDRNLARIARTTQDLPGQNLFEFLDESGCARPVGSADVNAYIQAAMGEEFSAKDFRTWGASVIAFEEITRRAGSGETIGIEGVIAPVAEALGNTAAISRKSYVHPALIDIVKAKNGKLPPRLQSLRRTKYLSGAERGLIAFLAKPRRKPARTPAPA